MSMKVTPEVSEWEKEFRELWKCEHSDCGGRGICQRKRIIEMFKPIIESVRNQTLEEALLEIDKKSPARIDLIEKYGTSPFHDDSGYVKSFYDDAFDTAKEVIRNLKK